MSCYQALLNDTFLGYYPYVTEVVVVMKQQNRARVEGVVLTHTRDNIYHIAYGEGSVSIADLNRLPAGARLGDWLGNLLIYFNTVWSDTSILEGIAQSLKSRYYGFCFQILVFPFQVLFAFLIHSNEGMSLYGRVRRVTNQSNFINALIICFCGYLGCIRFFGSIDENTTDTVNVEFLIDYVATYVTVFHYCSAMYCYIACNKKEEITTISVLNIIPYLTVGVIMMSEPSSVNNFVALLRETQTQVDTVITTVRSAAMLHSAYTIYDNWVGFVWSIYSRQPVIGICLMVGMITAIPTTVFV